MKKTMKVFRVGILALALVITSCSVEDGEDGAMGLQGEQGIQGPQGEKGEQGEQGIPGNDGMDGEDASFDPIIFKVRGQGFAVKDFPAETKIEVDIWEVEIFDTADAFDMGSRRLIVPETGHYYLHAVVKQSNNITDQLFRLTFNVGGNNLGQTVESSVPNAEVNGIYFLTLGTEVWVEIQHFTTDRSHRLDGFGSYFEGYRIY